MQVPLDIDSLGDLDGGAARAIINKEIRTAIADLDDRGVDGKPRQVVIVINLQRMPEQEAIIAHVEAEAKAPKRRTANTLGLVRSHQGRQDVLFQTHSPENPYQRTLDEALDKNKDDKEG